MSLMIVVVVTFSMLIDGAKLGRLVLKLVPAQHEIELRSQPKKFCRLSAWSIAHFVAVKRCDSSCFCAISSSIFLLAVTIGVFDLIPAIGATLGVSVVCLVIFVQSGWLTTLKVLVICVILQQLKIPISHRA